MGEIVFMAVLIMTSAFFSGMELGFVSVYRSKVLYRLIHGSKAARIINYFYKKPHVFFSTILIGNNLVNVALATLFGSFLYSRGVRDFHLWAPIILMPILTIFGESLPKLTYKKYNYKLTFLSSYILYFFYIILYPLVAVFSLAVHGVQKLLGVPNSHGDEDREELRVATNEMIKVYGGDRLNRFNEGLTSIVEIPCSEFFKTYPSVVLSLKLSTKEAGKILMNSGRECGYVIHRDRPAAITLKSLLFSDNPKEALKDPLLLDSKISVGEALMAASRSDKDTIGFIEEGAKPASIFTLNEFRRLIFSRSFPT